MDIPQIHVRDLAAALDEGATVLDVRNPDEWHEARVPGAVLLPLGELADRLSDVPECSGPLFVICRSGGRSQRACEFLAVQGHEVANVAGGTLAWLEAGYTVARGPDQG